MKKFLFTTIALLTACSASTDVSSPEAAVESVKETATDIAKAVEQTAVKSAEDKAPISDDDKNRAEAYAAVLQRDFNRMMEWFPGEYDNMEQVYFDGNLKIPEGERHERIHHVFTPVDLPNFPGTTFYIEQYRGTDPEDVYRQRIYSFEPDNEENAVRLVIYIPKDAAPLKGAYKDLSKLDGLTPADFATYEGCEVYWRYGNGNYHGTMKEGACRVESKRSGKTLVITDDLQLSPDSIWIRDEAVDTDGNYIYGNKARIHHKNNRAAGFNCWVSPRKKNGEYAFINNLRIHDEGGWIRLESDEYEYEKIGLRMRNVVWPTGNNRPSRVLYAYRDGDEENAISYAWTSPDEPRIGINFRWVQASCTEGAVTIKPGINLKTGSGN